MEIAEFDLQWEGRRCRVGQLGARSARHVAARMMGLLGEALQSTSGEMNILAAGGALLRTAKPETLDWLTDTFMRVTQIERNPGEEDWASPTAFEDLVFGGPDGLARWMRWLAFCVDHSCRPFFLALVAESAQLQAAIRSRSPSQQSSRTNGSFTASQRVDDTPMG